MECAGRQHSLVHSILGATGHEGSTKGHLALTDGHAGGEHTNFRHQMTTLEVELSVLKEQIRDKVYVELEALTSSMGQLWVQVSAMQDELRKPPELPMSMYQQFHDRLLMQEQRRKEQDEHIKKLTERLHSVEVGGRSKTVFDDTEDEERAATMMKTLKDARKDFNRLEQEQLRGISAAGQEPAPEAPGPPETKHAAPPADSSPKPRKSHGATYASEEEGAVPPDEKDSPVQKHSKGQVVVVKETKSMIAREEQFRIGNKPKRAPPPLQALKHGNTTPVSQKTGLSAATSPTTIVSQEVQRPLPQLEEFEWAPSIWEASLFIGTNCIGNGAAVQLLGLLLFNIFAQAAFCWVAYTSFTDPKFNDDMLDDARHFRLTIGHDVKFQDTLTKTSLMSRVCFGGASLDMGTTQANLVSQIDSYVDGGGPLMCILALGSWTLVFLTELDRALNLSLALTKVPRQRITSLTVNSDSEITVEGWATVRYLLAAFILLIRLAISISLLLFGCFWLAYEVDVQQLLLNAVALGFVLEVDDMLYTLAPGQVKTLMAKLQPLPAAKFPACRGADIFSFVQVGFVVGLLVWMQLNVLEPQLDKMYETRDLFCAGNLDFVYTQDNMGLTYLSVTEALPDDAPRSEMARLAVSEGVQGITEDTESFDLTYGLVADDFVNALSPASIISSMTLGELVDMINPLCTDEAWSFLPVLKRNLGAFLYDRTYESWDCPAMEQYWYDQGAVGITVRMICPISAGCTGLFTPVYSLYASNGCPTACGTYIQRALMTEPCEDQDVIGTSYWESWVSYVGASMESATLDKTTAVAKLSTEGCAGLEGIENFTFPVFSKESLCTGMQFDVHPFAYACPQACGCYGSLSVQLLAACPTSCVVN